MSAAVQSIDRTTGHIPDLPRPIQRGAAAVENTLRGLLAQHDIPLYNLMEYQLGWRDEQGVPLDFPAPQARLHAGLCLLACQAAGADPAQALPSAAAVELIYQFSQVHQDIQDGSQHRADRSTVWWIWGPAQAINAGDGLHALGRLAIIELGQQDRPSEDVLESLHTLDAASLRMCEGIHQDLVFRERVDITTDSYIRMARDRTGALIGAALELGAAAAGCKPAIAQALRVFGEELGVALQIQEDIQMLWGTPISGKPLGTDIMNKKKSYPVVNALEQAPIAQKRELGTLLFQRVLEPPDVEKVTAILDAQDARASAQDAARRILDGAVGRLDDANLNTNGRAELEETARWLALRSANL